MGGWQPGQEPSPQLLTLLSSRIKLLKPKQLITEDNNPLVPTLLVDRIERFDKEEIEQQRWQGVSVAKVNADFVCGGGTISQNLGTSELSKLLIHMYIIQYWAYKS